MQEATEVERAATVVKPDPQGVHGCWELPEEWVPMGHPDAVPSLVWKPQPGWVMQSVVLCARVVAVVTAEQHDTVLLSGVTE
jgi:hypothetical protein